MERGAQSQAVSTKNGRVITMKDVDTPVSLKELQNWFGSVITGPIDENSSISDIAPSGHTIEEEAKRFIRPSATLSPKNRIEIYNQQYWWRLLSIMHENFPLVTTLFGYFDFNQSIAMPYLQKYPPHHWSLNFLGDSLPVWISEYYHQDDKDLVLESVHLDLSYNLSFTAGERSALINDEFILKRKVATQPHLFLLKMKYDLIPFRAYLLKHNPDYFTDHDFPKLNKKEHHIALYRDSKLNIASKEISASEYMALQKFKEGLSVEEFCNWLETQETSIVRDAEKNLILWFQEWIAIGWLGTA